MAGLSALARQVDVFTHDLLGPARQAMMAQAAQAAFQEAMDVNTHILGKPPDWKRFVDGIEAAPVNLVKPGGNITYVFDVARPAIKEAVDVTLAELRRISPVDPYRANDIEYKKSHIVLVNNVERSYGSNWDIGDINHNDEVQITNLLPYARRLERVNKKLGRAWSAQAPNGVYEVVFNAIKSRYSKILYMRFTWASFPGHEIGKTKTGGPLKTLADFRRSRIYPTILIKAK